jgi:hypothetical protein
MQSLFMLTSADPDQDLYRNILAAASLFCLAFPISFPIHYTCRHRHPCEAGEHPPHTASFQYFFPSYLQENSIAQISSSPTNLAKYNLTIDIHVSQMPLSSE